MDIKLGVTRGQLRVILGWIKTTIIIGFWTLCVLGFVLVIATGSAMQERARARPCVDLGGHYVPSTLGSAAECWSTDGTRRLFPKE